MIRWSDEDYYLSLANTSELVLVTVGLVYTSFYCNGVWWMRGSRLYEFFYTGDLIIELSNFIVGN